MKESKASLVELSRKTIVRQEWRQPRVGTIDEVERGDGTIRFNVKVQDAGRPQPFIDQWFSRQEAATNFLGNIIDGAEEVQR
jgi:hypothetical protein